MVCLIVDKYSEQNIKRFNFIQVSIDFYISLKYMCKIIGTVQDTDGIKHYINHNYIIRIERSGFADCTDMYKYTIYMLDKHQIDVYEDALHHFYDDINI